MASRSSSPDSEELTVAVAAAMAAGDLLLRFFAQGVEPSWKALRDPVTEADLAAERLIREHISAAFGDDPVVGEEGAPVPEAEVSGRRRWYLDPLDGTMNFMKGRSRWATTVAFCDTDDRISAAVVVRPTSGKVYSAQRGKGAWCDGEALRVAETDSLDASVVGVGVLGAFELTGKALLGLSEHAMGVRVSGSTVCDLCEVADGKLDGFWQATTVKRWDLAAGTLLVAEAGGTVTTAHDVPLSGPSESILAGAPTVHADMARLVA